MKRHTLMQCGLCVLAAMIVAAGCATRQQEYAARGAAGGGVIGAILGNNIDGLNTEEGALLGAITGGLFGGHVGQTRVEQERARRQIQQLEKQANTETIWIRNSNGSRTAVIMQKAEGGQWIGPKGEYYDHLPSAAELRPVYGI